MREATNWLPGQIVLGVAFVLALAYVLVSVFRKSASTTTGAHDDLTAKYNGLVAELREHVANRHLLPSDAWEREKARLEQAAVAVLREREVVTKHEALKSEARAEKRAAVASGGSTFKGILIGGGTVGFFVLLGFLLTDSVKPRTDGMTATGAMPPGMPAGAEANGMPPPDDSKLKALFEAVQKKPDDIEALADMSLHLMRRQGFEEAKPFVLRATSIDPFHVRTRVARAVLSAVEGSVAGAQDELERLGARYGEAYDANLFAGLIAMDQSDQRRAIAAFDRYFAVAPVGDTPPMMKMAVEQMKRQLETAPAP